MQFHHTTDGIGMLYSHHNGIGLAVRGLWLIGRCHGTTYYAVDADHNVAHLFNTIAEIQRTGFDGNEVQHVDVSVMPQHLVPSGSDVQLRVTVSWGRGGGQETWIVDFAYVHAWPEMYEN